MKQIEEEWKKFEANVIHRNAPDIQRKEMKKAFYSGVWTVLQLATTLSDDDVTEEAGADALMDMANECKEFIVELIEASSSTS